MTGPDQFNIESERRAAGTAVQGVVEEAAGGRETVDAVVALAQVLMRMLMLMLGRARLR